MPTKTSTKPAARAKKPAKVTTSIYIHETTLVKVDAQAEKEDRSRNFVMERAIERDLEKPEEGKVAA